MLKLADEGDNTEVDMLVGDIYGTNYDKIGLKSTTIASTFGKVFKKNMQSTNTKPSSKMTNGDSSVNGVNDINGDSNVNGVNGVNAEIKEYKEQAPWRENMKNFKSEDISRSLLYAIRYVTFISLQSLYFEKLQNANRGDN